MIGPEWNHEKSVIFLRWILAISIFAGMFFFISENPGAVQNVGRLVKLGIGVLIGYMFLHVLFGRLEIDHYHYLAWTFDLIAAFLLVKFTGGIYAGQGEVNQPVVNFFTFLFPLLVLNNAAGRSVCEGVGSALVVDGVLAYFFFSSPPTSGVYWGLFIILGLLNVALGSLSLFTQKWIVVGDVDEMKKKKLEVEKAYQNLRKEVEVRKNREQELYDKTRKLTTVIQVSRALGSSYHLFDLFETIVEKAREEVNSRMAFIMLEKEGKLEVVYSEGVSLLTKEVLECRVEKGQGVIADVMLKSESIKLNRKEQPEMFEDFIGAAEKLNTLLVVPLRAPNEKKPLGVLGVANLLIGESYTSEHEDFLGIFAIEAAMFIRQLKLKHDLEHSYFELIMALAQAIEAKDPYTRGHVQRVQDYSVKLARALKLNPLEIKRIEKAAILHDIGKIATPENILNKPGRLTDEEFVIMKDHVVESRKMLADITVGIDEKTKDYVAYHHERWDGKGYPKGLKQDEIPLGAQIIAVADTFDAMTSDRPYRKGFEVEDALKRLVDTAGSQFNPKVLHTFFDIMHFDKKTRKLKKELPETIDTDKKGEKMDEKAS